ncbi:MAG: hypothetical protein D6785_04405, partial [Planctomycetota bacterium]
MNNLDNLLVQLALQEGFITRNQLQQCQQLKAVHFPQKSLIQILLDQRFLNEDDLRLLQRRSQQVSQLSSSKDSRTTLSGTLVIGTNLELQQKKDKSFGNFCIRLGFASQEQVLQCIQEQHQLQQKGLYVRLGELMLEKGILTVEQVERILEYQKKRILTCSGCKAQYNVSNYKAGTKVKCKKCGTILVVPSTLGNVKAEDSIYMEKDGDESSDSISESVKSPIPPSQISMGPRLSPTHDPAQDSIPSKETRYDSIQSSLPPLNLDFSSSPPSSIGESGISLDFEDQSNQQEEWDNKETNIISGAKPTQIQEDFKSTGIERRQGKDRRSGEDRRKKNIKWEGKERRKGGDRRKGERRKELTPEQARQQKIQKILVSFILGICGILVIFLFMLMSKPKNKLAAKRSYDAYEKALSEARFARDSQEFKNSLVKFKEALENLENAIAYGGVPSEVPLEKRKKELLKELRHLQNFLTFQKTKNRDALFKVLQELGNHEINFTDIILKELANLQDTRILPYFKKKLLSPDSTIGDEIYEYLKNYHGSEKEEKVITMLGEVLTQAIQESKQSRQKYLLYAKKVPRIIWLLSYFGGDQAIRILKKIILYSERGAFILAAIQSLNQIGGRETIPVLLKALNMQIPEIQQEARKGLVRTGVHALPHLLRMIKESEPHTPPVAAISILGELASSYPEATFQTFEKLLNENRKKERWDICFYVLQELVKIPNLSKGLKLTMEATLFDIAKKNPEKIERSYYIPLFKMAKFLGLKKEQLVFLTWLENLQKLSKTFKFKELPKEKKIGAINGSYALVEIEN